MTVVAKSNILYHNSREAASFDQDIGSFRQIGEWVVVITGTYPDITQYNLHGVHLDSGKQWQINLGPYFGFIGEREKDFKGGYFIDFMNLPTKSEVHAWVWSFDGIAYCVDVATGAVVDLIRERY